MPQLLGLIFDLDGTLVDSAADLRQALNAVLSTHDRRALTLVEVKEMIGDGLQSLLDKAFKATGAPLAPSSARTLIDDFLKLYQNQKASPDQLYPGAAETLAVFGQRGIKVGLCTNKMYTPTMKLFNDIGISDLFDFVAGSDTFPVYKPHPGHVLGVAKGLKVPPAACVMIGDSTNDIAAARGAGVASIAVSHGYGRDVRRLGADAVIDHFSELSDSLRRLGFDFVG